MPVFRLTDALVFPPPEGASPEGIVAVGGDYRAERLLLGYTQGIFPWPSEGLPPLWFSPDPRFVLPLDDAHVPRSLRKTMRRGTAFRIVADTAFVDVIDHCAKVPRPGQRGTWITDELRLAYEVLHELGYAHSVEAWCGGKLVGGLYGVALGGVFFGESMFSLRHDASKVATVHLLAHLRTWHYELLDCQVHTDHLARFGAINWPRATFLSVLRHSIEHRRDPGPWQLSLTTEQVLDTMQRR